MRITRFFDDNPVVLPSKASTFSDAEWEDTTDFLNAWDFGPWEAEHWTNCTPQKVKKAAEGILIEGEKLNDDICKKQAKEIADELVLVANSDLKTIQKSCLHLYTKETFLYKLINEVLRNRDMSKVDTLGPFCSILNNGVRSLSGYAYQGVVYRGVLLTSEQVNRYENARSDFLQWDSFVSTTKNRNLAMFYGNTLFTIEIDMYARGLDISSFSNFPEEDEVLIRPGRPFSINDMEFNTADNKYHIDISISL
ncbi:unnamed protein product [Adineta ricciae]|uniref:NAD(P)(+)--arginine ADP-ribosyltransferase n=1 Tax=Adineta ricciae TaxID=249248 RepID=A0A816CKC4_ADIRI|nr:unnamed protein product [Adineta ricciae]CAF1622812.1 unnamed protein product [Adineta ricciae]